MVPLVIRPANIPYTFQGLIRFVASKNCLEYCLGQYETIICYTAGQWEIVARRICNSNSALGSGQAYAEFQTDIDPISTQRYNGKRQHDRLPAVRSYPNDPNDYAQIAPGTQYSRAIAILGGSQKKKNTSALRALLRPLSLGGPLKHVRNSSLRNLQSFTDKRARPSLDPFQSCAVRI